MCRLYGYMYTTLQFRKIMAGLTPIYPPISSAFHTVRCMPDDMFPAAMNRVFYMGPAASKLTRYI